jgi:hypothetical protein
MPMPRSISVATIATTIAVFTNSMMTGFAGLAEVRSAAYRQHPPLGGGRIAIRVSRSPTRNDGRADRAKSSLKDASEKVKDAVRKARRLLPVGNTDGEPTRCVG